MLIERTACRCLDCREIHPVSGARTNQPRSADMHFADRRHHLLDRTDFFDCEKVRQKSLIDQLHDAFIVRLKPDRSKMLPANFHAFWVRARSADSRSSAATLHEPRNPDTAF